MAAADRPYEFLQFASLTVMSGTESPKIDPPASSEGSSQAAGDTRQGTGDLATDGQQVVDTGAGGVAAPQSGSPTPAGVAQALAEAGSQRMAPQMAAGMPQPSVVVFY